MIKSLETDMTINSLSWADGYEDIIKQLGLDDRNLKSLRKFGESRCVNLERACMLWDNAEQTLKMLMSMKMFGELKSNRLGLVL